MSTQPNILDRSIINNDDVKIHWVTFFKLYRSGLFWKRVFVQYWIAIVTDFWNLSMLSCKTCSPKWKSATMCWRCNSCHGLNPAHLRIFDVRSWFSITYDSLQWMAPTIFTGSTSRRRPTSFLWLFPKILNSFVLAAPREQVKLGFF